MAASSQRDDPICLRLYLDEDVHKRVAAALRMRQFDVVSAHELQRQGLTDEQQIAYASTAGRAIVTYNSSDFARLHVAWLTTGRTHAGIIISSQVSISETVRRLLYLLNRVTAEEMFNQLQWLQVVKL